MKDRRKEQKEERKRKRREERRKEGRAKKKTGERQDSEIERGCYLMCLAGMHYMLTLVGQPAQK